MTGMVDHQLVNLEPLINFVANLKNKLWNEEHPGLAHACLQK